MHIDRLEVLAELCLFPRPRSPHTHTHHTRHHGRSGILDHRLLVGTIVAHAHQVVPATRGHRLACGRAPIAHSLAAGAAVVDRIPFVEAILAESTGAALVVGHPVVGSSRVLDPACVRGYHGDIEDIKTKMG